MRFLIALSLPLFIVAVSLAAVTQRGLDAVSQSAFVSANTVSWTHVLGGCAHNVLVVSCGNDASTITSVTFANISATQRIALTSTETSQIWTLSNSTTTGSGTITATFGGAVNGMCGAVSFCGANDGAPLGGSASAQATGTNPTLAVTVASSGSWVVDSFFNNGTTMQPATSIQNNHISTLFNSGGPSALNAHWFGPVQNGSNTAQWTQSVSAAWTKTIMAVKPSSGTPILTTQLPTSVTQTSATGNGTILFHGSYTITAQGICVSSNSANPTTADSCFTGSGTPFTASITGLAPGVLYWAAAYATNSEGTDYGYPAIPFVTQTPIGYFFKPGSGKITFVPGSGTIAGK